MHIFFENVNATPTTVVTNEMYNDGAGNIYIGTNRGITQIKGGTLGATTFTTAHGGFLHGSGTSSSPNVSATAGNFMSYYLSDTATSGDSRGMYLRLYISGIGGGGEALRAFGTVNNVAGATARGAHISLSFGTTGSITGLGTAMTATLHVPGAMTGGTYAVINAEANADAAASTLAGATAKSFFRVGAIGDSTGAALIMDTIPLFDFVNAPGAGKMIDTNKTALTGKAGIKVTVNGTLYGYIPIVTGS